MSARILHTRSIYGKNRKRDRRVRRQPAREYRSCYINVDIIHWEVQPLYKETTASRIQRLCYYRPPHREANPSASKPLAAHPSPRAPRFMRVLAVHLEAVAFSACSLRTPSEKQKRSTHHNDSQYCPDNSTSNHADWQTGSLGYNGPLSRDLRLAWHMFALWDTFTGLLCNYSQPAITLGRVAILQLGSS